MNLLFVFLTGLTTGGLSCLAVQGGLLASVIANQKKQTDGMHSWLPVAMFLVAKLASHTVLGFFLGLLGSTITLSLELRLVFQVLTALFMVATAMNLLQVHPIFRHVSFQSPKFFTRMVKSTSKSNALFAPLLLGALTIFIPCGVTQAMEVLAINSGSPIQGAAIMFAFVLGTTPLFAALGIATTKLSEVWQVWFSRIAAVSLILMALYSLNGVLIVTDPASYFRSKQESSAPEVLQSMSEVQNITITALNSGYQPKKLTVKSGLPVRLTLRSDETYSCSVAFVFKEFGIDTFLEPTDEEVFTFLPTKPGKYRYTCSMGMYTGVLEVL